MARTLTGIVSSNKPDKTIVVSVAVRKTHPLYKKQYTKTTKFMAHDESNEAEKGDRVTITESRPLSAKKRFILFKVVSRAAIQHTEPEPSVSSQEEAAESIPKAPNDKVKPAPKKEKS